MRRLPLYICIVFGALVVGLGCEGGPSGASDTSEGNGTVPLCDRNSDCPNLRICLNGACIRPGRADAGDKRLRDTRSNDGDTTPRDVLDDSDASDGRRRDVDRSRDGSREIDVENGDTDGRGDDADREGDTPLGRCRSSVDADGDGLSDACECRLGTSSGTADTDADGLDDAAEVGGDCSFDWSEGDTNPLVADTDGDGLEDGRERDLSTNPRKPDTDGDGLDDATEVKGPTDPLEPDTDGDGLDDGIEADTCTDPTAHDTDSDGIPDGVEDADGDGRIGSCPNRRYSRSCADGETDPCEADSDSDGFTDERDTCRPRHTRSLISPRMVANSTGNYRLALPSNARTDDVDTSSGSLRAHLFVDPARRYTGFVLDYETDTTQRVSALASEVTGHLEDIYQDDDSIRVQSRATGEPRPRHDGDRAMTRVMIELGGRNDASPPGLLEVRDRVLKRLAGVNTLDYVLDTSFQVDRTRPTLVAYQVVRRANRVTLVVVVTRSVDYDNNRRETGWAVDDLVGGGALARHGVSTTRECLALELDTTDTRRRLRGIPLPSTLRVEHFDISSTTSTHLERSRHTGFDYRRPGLDLVWKGASPPHPPDELIVTYHRWDDSVASCSSSGSGCREPRICVRGRCW